MSGAGDVSLVTYRSLDFYDDSCNICPTTLDHAYAWKTIRDADVVLAGGSDAPVEEPKPSLGIYDAVFRQKAPRDAENIGDPATTFRPEECLRVGAAIDAFTVGSAWAAGRDESMGKIEAGFCADFVVMADDADVVTDPSLWLKADFSQVWVGGVRRK